VKNRLFEETEGLESAFITGGCFSEWTGKREERRGRDGREGCGAEWLSHNVCWLK